MSLVSSIGMAIKDTTFDDLVYLHQLVLEVSKWIESDEKYPSVDYTQYREFGVGAYSYRANREEHKEALLILLTEAVNSITSSSQSGA